MKFPKDPIEYLDGMVDLHKKRLRSRKVASESLMYMQEASDQVGFGEEFLRLWVHNPQPKQPDPASEETDLAMLDLYKHWRKLHNLRPIESWDGTRLRPWLEPEYNPRIPAALAGDLDCFNRAFSHNPPFEDLYWRRADALGNAVESYLTAIRRHQVWAPAIPGGEAPVVRAERVEQHRDSPILRPVLRLSSVGRKSPPEVV